MKTLVISDIHGISTWKKIINDIEHDEVVFLGDYFDSFDVKPEDQITNFQEILAYKRSNPEKVKLLIGNHDYHYLPGIDGKCSGYNMHHATTISVLLDQALPDMQLCYFRDDVIFSHAGFSRTWMGENELELEDLEKISLKNPILNFKFKLSGDPTGNNSFQGPLWIRPFALSSDAIIGFDQVVGHTNSRAIRKIYSQNNRLIYVTDCLERNIGYEVLVYDENGFKIHSKALC